MGIRHELTELRGRFVKHFATDEDGVYVARIGASPLHFEREDGSWDELSNLVQSVPGGWAAITKDVRFGVENGWLTVTHKGRSLQMRPTAVGMVDRTAPATRWQKLADANYANVSRSGDEITITDIFPQTDLRLTLSDEALTKAFTIRQRPNLPDPVSLGWDPDKTFLVIVWDVQLPSGAVVRDTDTLAQVGNGYAGRHDLVVETSSGDPVVYFRAGTAESAIGRTHPVWYLSAGANVPFGEAVPYAKAAIARYPLVIDPTVQITSTAYPATAIWQYTDYYQTISAVSDWVAGRKNIWVDPDPKQTNDEFNAGEQYVAAFRFDLRTVSANITAAKFKWDSPGYASLDTDNTDEQTIVLDSYDSDFGVTWDLADVEAAHTFEDSLSFTADSSGAQELDVNPTRLASRFGGYACFRLSGTLASEALHSNFARGVRTSTALEVTYTTFTAPFLADVRATTASSSTSCDVSFPTSTEAGDLVIVTVQTSAESCNNTPSGWTRWLYDVPYSNVSLAVFAKFVTAGDVATGYVTVSKTGAAYSWYCTAMRVLGANADPLDASDIDHAASGGTVQLDITTVTNNTLVIGVIAQSSTGVVSTMSNLADYYVGLSQRQQVRRALQSTAGSFSSIADAASTLNIVAALVAIRPEHPFVWDGPGIIASAVVSKTQSGSFTASAVIKREQSGSFSIDSVVLRELSDTLLLDAVVGRSNEAAATADAIVRRAQPGSATADALILQPNVGSASADSVVRRTALGATTTDAVISRVATAGLTTDAIVLRDAIGSFTASASFFAAMSGSATADAYIQVTGTVAGSLAADAIVKRFDTTGSLTADALIVEVSTGTFSADAIYSATRSVTLALDSIIRRGKTDAVSASSVVLRTNTDALAASAAIAATRTYGFTLSSVVLSPETHNASADAVVTALLSGTFAADAFVSQPVSGSFSSDAYILSGSLYNFDADAVLRREQTGAASASAFIAATGAGFLNADAVIVGATSSSFSASALVLVERIASFSASAVLFVPTFTADALIVSAQSGVITLSAIIAGVHPQFDADLVIDEIAADLAVQEYAADIFVTEYAATLDITELAADIEVAPDEAADVEVYV
jgi:hypothetical protein